MPPLYITNRPPADYFSYLGDKSRYKRKPEYNESLYYSIEKRQLLFYDKVKQSRKYREKIPEAFKGKHLLRYEVKFTNCLEEQFQADVTGAMLYDIDFHSRCVQILCNEFRTISKINKTGINTDMIKTPKDLPGAIATLYLQEKGQQEVDEIISDLKAAKAFSDKKYYSRAKSHLNEIISAQKASKSETVKELEKAIFELEKSISNYPKSYNKSEELPKFGNNTLPSVSDIVPSSVSVPSVSDISLVVSPQIVGTNTNIFTTTSIDDSLSNVSIGINADKN